MGKAVVVRGGLSVPSSFIKYLEGKADDHRSRLNSYLEKLGFPSEYLVLLGREITYRLFSDCKTPYFSYFGEGGSVSLPLSASNDLVELARVHLALLIDLSETVWALGGRLAWDKSCKHTIFFQGFHF